MTKNITDLRRGQRREKRINVFLDGSFAFSLQADKAAAAGLRIGQALSERRVEELAGADRQQRCLDAALRYLSYRPRSEAEVSGRLRRHGFSEEEIAAAMARLKKQGLVDDAAFVAFWQDNRRAFSPRSQRLTRAELKQKGVSEEIIQSVPDETDDSDSAYRAAIARARRLSAADYQGFRRGLGEYLRRRGFGYEVINQTVSKVWQECWNQPAGYQE